MHRFSIKYVIWDNVKLLMSFGKIMLNQIRISSRLRGRIIMEDQEILYWLILRDLKIPDLKRIAELLKEKNVNLAEILEGSRKQLKNIGLDEKTMQHIVSARKNLDKRKYYDILGELKKQGISVIRYIDQEYPETLRRIRDPPLILFHKGSLKRFEQCIAIVGTRNASLFGRQMAREISRYLAEFFIIVSGLARGIDTEAHCGALEANQRNNGVTLAVLPWIYPVYPSENEELLKDITKRGAAISENFEKPKNKRAKNAFVKRNRIISAISSAIIVVETGEKGGTMHTVRYAKKYGKLIFVIKPPQEHFIEKRRSVGGFKVLKEKYGAIEVDCSDPKEAADFIRKRVLRIVRRREKTLEDFISE